MREQVEKYEASGGTEAGELNGVPVVILTTRGRHTGKLRKSPLMRVEHDGTYAVVASMGGAPKHPVWYLNLLADPDVTVQDGPTVHDSAHARVDGDEKASWWQRANAVWPDYDSYQARTDRSIPVVVLEPAETVAGCAPRQRDVVVVVVPRHTRLRENASSGARAAIAPRSRGVASRGRRRRSRSQVAPARPWERVRSATYPSTARSSVARTVRVTDVGLLHGSPASRGVD